MKLVLSVDWLCPYILQRSQAGLHDCNSGSLACLLPPRPGCCWQIQHACAEPRRHVQQTRAPCTRHHAKRDASTPAPLTNACVKQDCRTAACHVRIKPWPLRCFTWCTGNQLDGARGISSRVNLHWHGAQPAPLQTQTTSNPYAAPLPHHASHPASCSTSAVQCRPCGAARTS